MNENHVNFWHIQLFRGVMTTGGFAEAARQAGLTQPAVSNAVSALEKAFGAPLLARGGRPAFTDKGSVLMERGRRALDLLTAGLREAGQMNARSSVQVVRAISGPRLRALVAIVKFGSFAEAARAIGVARPTLHRAARDLERYLGRDLFERTSHGVRPSRQAEVLARYASLAFAEIRQARAEMAAFGGQDAGSTVIGAMPLGRSFIIPAAVQEFTATNPRHRISILEGAYENLVAGLRRGDVDFLVGALRGDHAASDLEETKLFDDALSIVMRVGHPATGTVRLTRQTLRKFSWIAPRPESPLRRSFEALFSPSQPPQDIVECNSLSAARVILMRSDRLMLLSDVQIRFEKEAGALVSRPLAGASMLRPIGLTTRKDWRPTREQQRLVDLVAAEAAARNLVSSN
ncbi:MAG TPA: LysR family transcriptional regulator [Parvularcula sp.]|nr:LysR family transcriptional regulator [Parvularcula sp.]